MTNKVVKMISLGAVFSKIFDHLFYSFVLKVISRFAVKSNICILLYVGTCISKIGSTLTTST